MKKETPTAKAVVQLDGRQAAPEEKPSISDIAGRLAAIIKPELETFATDSYAAENAPPESSDGKKSKPKKRAPFPLIFKYLCRNVIFTHIDAPSKKVRKLKEKYRPALGLTRKSVIFADFYKAEIISLLKGLKTRSNKQTKANRRELKAALVPLLLTDIESSYIQPQMGIQAKTISDEYALFSGKVRGLFEGGLEGYFACRLGLLNRFGSVNNVEETIKMVNQYYGSLVKADFLVGGKKVGGTGTQVHPDLKTAFTNAETLIKNKGWRDEIMDSTGKYWSTNIRENRNNITKLSDHSFGWAVDIDPGNNKNYAQSKKNLGFFDSVLGEPLFDKETKTTIKTSSNTQDILDATNRLRAKSDKIKHIFENEANLKAQLQKILRQKGASLPPDKQEELFTLAKDCAADQILLAKTRNRKKKREINKRIQTYQRSIFGLLYAELGKNITAAPAYDTTTYPDPIDGEVSFAMQDPIIVNELTFLFLGKASRPKLSSVGALNQIAELIRTQIQQAERAKVPKSQRKFRLTKTLVRKLKKLSEGDRQKISTRVLGKIREQIEKNRATKGSKNLAYTLTESFVTLAKSRNSEGNKVGAGTQKHNIAAQGVTNLNTKLITALVSPEGGNLKWLGVANHDMHHFELKDEPVLPKAQAPKSTTSADGPAETSSKAMSGGQHESLPE
ncbi:MAG: hypothetical protein AAF587_14440 [Bacteroidota bacterium]